MTVSDPTISGPAALGACSLSAGELDARLQWIREQILPHVRRTELLPDGLAWEFERSAVVQAKLERLVALERECCDGLDFDLRELSDETLRLVVGGVDPGSELFDALRGPGDVPAGGG